jgi:hypothetical protein
LPAISKYCVTWRSFALASLNVSTRLTPSIGICGVPLTTMGSGRPAAARMVGATSVTWLNWVRISFLALMPLGQ